MLCANLQVSPSGYYDWDRRRCSPRLRAVEDFVLAEEIAASRPSGKQQPLISVSIHDSELDWEEI